MTITVKLHEIVNAGPKQTDIATRACEALQTAVNHPEFKTGVETATYKETRYWDRHGNSRSIPASEIHDFIAGGLERDTAADQEIDIRVKLSRMDAVGSTVPGKLPFRTAYWFVNQCIARDDPASLAGHFMHEWLHVVGFHHYPNNSARGDVPYVVGQLVVDLLNEREGFAPVVAAEKSVVAAPYHGEEADLPEEDRDESLMM